MYFTFFLKNPGASTVAQAQENHAAISSKISHAFWQELKEKGVIAADAPVPAA